MKMAELKKYPVGMQTFQKIVEGGYLYVDKTALMHRLVNEYNYVFLSRPRRFGKSLLLSTMESYFEGKRELFEGLDISRLEKEWESYPVFRADLSSESYDHPDKLRDRLELLATEWCNVYGFEEMETTPAAKFRGVIRRAYEQTGRKVVLIDEYDKPILESLHDEGLNARMRDSLRGFYSVLKESDRYIRFAMLTGVTKIGHVSVFSGLNNLRDISLSPDYNEICGISELEFRRDFADSISAFSHRRSISEEEAWNQFRINYDGYCFSESGQRLYNPYSVLSALDEGKLRHYWFQTGTPSFLARLFKRYSYPLWELEGTWRSGNELSDMTLSGRNLAVLLYQSGYLTIKGYDERHDRYQLGFPNLEVSEGFWNSLYKYYIFRDDYSPHYTLRRFKGSVTEGNAKDFMDCLCSLVSSLSPGTELRREIHFQNVVEIIFKMLGFEVHTEVRSSHGRADMIVQTSGYVYIFEFKVNSSSESALNQIHAKGYADPYVGDGRKVILIGASFSTATSTIDDYRIEYP